MKNTITIEEVSAALEFLSADVSRHEWAKVGAAIKSEFSDDTGLALFDRWSATGTGYSSKAVASTWRSLKAHGGITIATLLGMAKERGFALSKGDQAAPKPDPATVARLASERKARQQAEQAQERAAHDLAAIEAGKRWDSASDSGESGYVARKKVQPFGVRFTADGWLLVPLRDASGKLWNTQRIAPVKPEKGSDKFYEKGARKSGCWHMLGDPMGAEVILICEGYGTGASLHEATNLPTAVGFDSGNLIHVAKALRKQYPLALLVVAGDDDRDTHARTGRNPGFDAATAAARAVRGLAVFPEGLAEDLSDFNDLHVSAGLDAVRSIVMTAIYAHAAHQAGAEATQSPKAGNGRVGNGNARNGTDSEAAPAHDWDRYFVTDAGVFYEGIDAEGNKKPPVWVCSRLDVEARTRDQDGGGWGYLLKFADPLGKAKQWAMPARMLSGDGGEYRATLLGMGLLISSTPSGPQSADPVHSNPPAPKSLQAAPTALDGTTVRPLCCPMKPSETMPSALFFKLTTRWKTHSASRAQPSNGAIAWGRCALAIRAWRSPWPVPLPVRRCGPVAWRAGAFTFEVTVPAARRRR
jgi:putative DNA primase/helicase